MSTKIKIDLTERQHVTREADHSPGAWDADDIDHTHSIDGYTVVADKDRWDFILTEDPKNKTLYLVYTLYDTGDSFHQETNVLCLVGLYEHEKDAQAVMRAIEDDYRKSGDSFAPVKVALPKADRLETIGVSTWKGYFERLNEVRVEPLSSTGKNRIRFR